MRHLPVTVAGALVGVSVMLLGAGCGGGSSTNGSAAAFVHRVTIEFSRGQSGRLWDSLVPSEQAVVSRQRFIGCRSNTGFWLRTFKALETYDESVDVDGRETPSTAVTVQVTSDDGVTTATMHAVRVSGAWRWMLQPSELAAYSAGRCP